MKQVQSLTPIRFYETRHKDEVLLCPLSGVLLSDPVILPDGITYQRQAIFDYAKAHPAPRRSIVTDQLLDEDSFENPTPNFLIKRYVEMKDSHEARDECLMNVANVPFEAPVVIADGETIEEYQAKNREINSDDKPIKNWLLIYLIEERNKPLLNAMIKAVNDRNREEIVNLITGAAGTLLKRQLIDAGMNAAVNVQDPKVFIHIISQCLKPYFGEEALFELFVEAAAQGNIRLITFILQVTEKMERRYYIFYESCAAIKNAIEHGHERTLDLLLEGVDNSFDGTNLYKMKLYQALQNDDFDVLRVASEFNRYECLTRIYKLLEDEDDKIIALKSIESGIKARKSAIDEKISHLVHLERMKIIKDGLLKLLHIYEEEDKDLISSSWLYRVYSPKRKAIDISLAKLKHIFHDIHSSLESIKIVLKNELANFSLSALSSGQQKLYVKTLLMLGERLNKVNK